MSERPPSPFDPTQGPFDEPSLDTADDETPSDWIGPYRLLQQIGEGGFGSIYLAEQEHPVRRRVALKIIKLGMDTRQVIARFEAERQALAMMDHPNIAHVFEAGATETGRPYFVMELVRGVPITEYCDKHNLSTSERLELFLPVCAAVQHAHQKGIIHRDIKPSNVLITMHDGPPAPKVIDFGIAKATSTRLTEKTVYTELRQFIGTPEYMSPEQAEMSSLDIDTRSDIYSLGVLLYELLTGTTPFERQHLFEAGFGEIQRIIREEEPPRPSTRLSTMGEQAAEVARHRRSDAPHLVRSLRGDLDWIIMRAMEKDRTRRYETAHGFALDIQRHLDREPVRACPPSTVYRVKKFVIRNKGPVVAAALSVLLLVGGVTGTSIGLVASKHAQKALDASLAQEAEQRQRAEENAVRADREADRANREAAEAHRQAHIAVAVNAFLNDDLLAAAAPSAEQGRGRDVAMREVLDAAAERIDEASRSGGRFAEEPVVEASIRATLGRTYRLLGNYDLASPHLQRALVIRRAELGDAHPETLGAMNSLANLLVDQGRYEEAEPLLVESLAGRRRVLGDDDRDTLVSAGNLAGLYATLGRYDDAEPLMVEVLEHRREVLGLDNPDTLSAMHALANLRWRQGRLDEAQSLHEETLSIRRRSLGESHPDTLASMNNVASIYWRRGRFEDAEPLQLRVLELRREVLGDEHPRTLSSLNGLGGMYFSQGRYDDAEPLFREALEISRRVLGEEHPATLDALNNLALVYGNQGRADDAEPLVARIVEIRTRAHGETHPDTLLAMNNLAVIRQQLGQLEEAAILFARVLELRREALGAEHPDTLLSMNNLAVVYEELDRIDEAEPLLDDALAARIRTLGEDHPHTLASMLNLAKILVRLDRLEEAEPLLREAMRRYRDVHGPDHAETLQVMENLAIVAARTERAEEATALFEELIAIRRRQASDDGAPASSLNAAAMLLLTCKIETLRRPDDALDYALRANELTRHEDSHHLDTLARAYEATGDVAHAATTQRRAVERLPVGASHRSAYEERLAEYEAAAARDGCAGRLTVSRGRC